MAFRTYRDVNLTINGKKILANSVSLEQDIQLSHPLVIGERTTTKNTPTSHKSKRLSISYYITGNDILKDYVDQNENFTITGNLNGLSWKSGYLESYSLNGSPSSPVEINASLFIADEFNGTFTPATPTTPPETKVVNFNDCVFVANNATVINPNAVTSYNWNYSTTVTPVYYQQETGVVGSSPDRVVFGERSIEAQLVTDSENFDLDISGQQFALEFQARSPLADIAYELYNVSGVLNSKGWSISSDNDSNMLLSISQGHTNSLPAIGSVDSSNFSGTGYILINSTNASTNGFFSRNNKISLVEKVFLEDRECEFTVSNGASYDTITAYVPYDAINGYLSVQTTKNFIQYSVPFTGLNFPEIVVSGIRIDSGNFGDVVTITGSNFYRVTDVKIGNKQASFITSKDNTPTGSQHFINLTIPKEAWSDKIQVLSSVRNRSGESPDRLRIQPVITHVNPTTGTFTTAILLSGYNLDGVTDVLFNTQPASSVGGFSFIGGSAFPPAVSLGFPKGQILVSGYNGMTAVAPRNYQPIVKILEITANSGTIEDDFGIVLDTRISDNYLHRTNSPGKPAYLVAFGNYTGEFIQSGVPNVKTLTGYAPTGIYSSRQIAMFEPDGVTQYPAYTGTYSEIGPAPSVDFVAPNTIDVFNGYNLQIYGDYMKDFFGLPYYVALSGHENNSFITYSNIHVSPLRNQIIVSGVFLDSTVGTGYYDVYVVNAAGSGFATGALLVQQPYNWAKTAYVAHYNPHKQLVGEGDILTVSPPNFAPSYAVDTDDPNSVTYSRTRTYAILNTGWYSLTFDDPINITAMRVYRNNIPSIIYEWAEAPNGRYQYMWAKMNTGFRAEFFDVGGTLTFARTGIGDASMTYEVSGTNFPAQHDSYLATGVKSILLIGTGQNANYWDGGVSPYTYNLFSAYNTITIYGVITPQP